MNADDAIRTIKTLAHRCGTRGAAVKQSEVAKHLFAAAALLRDAAKELDEAAAAAEVGDSVAERQLVNRLDEPSDMMRKMFGEVLDHTP